MAYSSSYFSDAGAKIRAQVDANASKVSPLRRWAWHWVCAVRTFWGTNFDAVSKKKLSSTAMQVSWNNRNFYERKSSFSTWFFGTSIWPLFHRFGYTNMASLTIRTPITSHRAIWHNTNQVFLSTPWKCTQFKSILTFVSLSAEVSLIVTEWFMKATILSDVSIFPSSVWCRCLLSKCLTITNGVIIKGYVHICGSHLSFGVRLTHVRKMTCDSTLSSVFGPVPCWFVHMISTSVLAFLWHPPM